MNAANIRIAALIPAYNEGPRVGTTVSALRSRCEVGLIIVVDDGSEDDTAEQARTAQANIVISQPNSGKGSALSAAYAAARDKADIFLLLDADLGITASEAIKLLGPVLRDEADMAIGLLPPDPDFAATGRSGGSGIVVRAANRGIERATGRTFKQPLSGQRAVRRPVLEALGTRSNVFAQGFGVEVGLTIGALRAGYRVVEVETCFRHKVTSSDWRGIAHRARQYFDISRTIKQMSCSCETKA